eukprot:TRINITY_DN13771_c0_g1_i1.p1 TRINITY_DN13771_c0_g1~~TRINITY_DN13771_c0_g1_i1.p1  ORF type:complete len:398 (-),score=90.05 TRINITY_DN13771_c0_g1_i1:627-1820(-)
MSGLSQAPPGTHHGLSYRQIGLLAFCIMGIWVSYLTQGMLQEILSTKKFGPDQQRFEHLAFLNLAQNVVCFCWAAIWLAIARERSTQAAPLRDYWMCGLSNSVGPALGLIALKYISYPAQVLAKSSKMIPVMLWGALAFRVKYTLPEYICTFLVAGGVAIFALFKSSSKALKKLARPNAPLGYTLCFLNLALDGWTNTNQDHLHHRFPHTSSFHTMLAMNLWGALYTALFMFGTPWGGGSEAVAFCRANPEAAKDLLVFCLSGAVGQNFIFLTIKHFGSLVNTTITTTRKFMSILLSALVTGNPLSDKQWGGVTMVFSGLSFQIYLKWQRMRAKQRASREAQAGGQGRDLDGLLNGGNAEGGEAASAGKAVVNRRPCPVLQGLGTSAPLEVKVEASS